MKKKTSKPTTNDDLSLDALVKETIREAIVRIRAQIAAGDVVATNVQALISFEKSLRRNPSDDPADLDRRVRELEPAERTAFLREWNRIDNKGSGLA